MPHLHSASLRPSLLALAIVSTLPGAAFAAADDITVTATGNPRSA
ncbi:hemin receptor, partial [Enterobacter sp. 63]